MIDLIAKVNLRLVAIMNTTQVELVSDECKQREID